MRLAELALRRFGRFEERRLDFGPADGLDLHLIYGPNEAGKSTLFAAMEDLFFGIPPRSRHAFRFEQSNLRIEGEVEAADAPRRRVARVHDRKAALRDVHEAPLPESVFGPALERLDRATYRQMFSLDEQSLREGARALLDSEGDAAEILFGSSLGLAEASRNLKAMREEADKLYRWRSNTTRLYQLRGELQDLRDRQKAADLTRAEYDRLIARRTEAAAQADAAHDAVRIAHAARQRRLRLLEALDDHAAYLADAPTLAGLDELPAPPAGWRERAAELHARNAERETAVVAAQERLQDLQERLDALPRDAAALEIAGRAEGLAGMEAGYRGAEASVPKRQEDIRACRRETAAIVARLGGAPDAEAEAFDLPAETLAALDRLSAEHIGLDAAAAAAARELADAKARAEEAVMLAPAVQARLAGAEQAAARADAVGERRHAEAVADEARATLAEALAALAPWRGDAETLAAQRPPPPEAIEGWRARARALEAEAADVGAARKSLEAARHAHARAALGAVLPAGLDDAGFQALRAARDALWQAHRAALDGASADAFAAKLAEVDAAAAARLAGADALAAARAAAAEGARHALDAERIEAMEARIAASRRRLADEAGGAAAALGLAATTTPEALAAWLDRRAEALRRHLAERAAQRAVAAAAARAQTLTDDLAAALAAADILPPADADLATLRVIATETLAAARAGRDAARDVERRAKDAAAAAAALDAWRSKWAAARAGTWLDARDADAGFFRAAAPDLIRLRELIAQIADFDLRIRKMAADRDAFVAETEALGAALGLADDGAPPGRAAAIRDRARAARDAETLRATLVADRDKAAEALGRAEDALRAHRAEIAEMADFYGVSGLDGLRNALAREESRARLAADQARRAAALRRAAETETTEAALAAFDGLGAVELAAEVEDLAARIEPLVQAAREADGAAATAAGALAAATGDADAAELDQARQTKLLEIEAAAKGWLRLSYGAAAAERAMARYRDEHRSAMLERASAAFARITRGSFARLETRLRDGRETLLAARPDDAMPLDDAGMSEGTRAQLYLALRIAAYHGFEGDPPPFVADDILETFDDDRAAETFQALAEMAARGQVIYLTHHAHLIEIARAAAPGIKVHELPRP